MEDDLTFKNKVLAKLKDMLEDRGYLPDEAEAEILKVIAALELYEEALKEYEKEYD